MGDTTGERRRSGRAHAATVEATVALLGEVGYPRLRLEAVAARAGVGKTTIYRWWPGRAQLVIEALRTLVDPPRMAFTGDGRADVRALVAGVEQVWADPVVADTLMGLAADGAHDPDVRSALARLLAPQRAADSAVLLSAAARGDLPHDVDVPLLLDVAFGTLLFRRLRGASGDVTDELAALIIAGTPPRAGH